MNKLRGVKILIVLLSIMLLFACASKEVKLTTEQEADRVYYEQKNIHNDAVIKYTQAATKYNLWCKNAEYADACAKVDKYWLDANRLLTVWGNMVDSRKPSEAAEEDYRTNLKALKSKLLMELPTYAW